jgi:hypothetical protein
METFVETERRLHRMESECAESVGQAVLLGLASIFLVGMLGLMAVIV